MARIAYIPETLAEENKGFLYFIFNTQADLMESIEFLKELWARDLMFHVTVTGEKILAEIFEDKKKIVDTGYVNCERTTMFKYKSEKRYKADSMLGVGYLLANKEVYVNNDEFEPVPYILEAMEAL